MVAKGFRGGGRERQVIFNEYRGSAWGEEKVLAVQGGDVHPAA